MLTKFLEESAADKLCFVSDTVIMKCCRKFIPLSEKKKYCYSQEIISGRMIPRICETKSILETDSYFSSLPLNYAYGCSVIMRNKTLRIWKLYLAIKYFVENRERLTSSELLLPHFSYVSSVPF